MGSLDLAAGNYVPIFLMTATIGQTETVGLYCFTRFGGATADRTEIVAIKLGALA